MYIIIPAASPVPYRQLKSLSFAPEVDLTLSSLPVNEFRADIITADSIEVGGEAILKDDMDQLWADYTITKAERVNKQCVRIVAQSYLTLMDRWKLPAEMFQNVKVPKFIEWLFSIPASGYLYTFDIDVDPYFNDITVTGFCPEQTARERLQWLCVTVGAVVRQCFSEALQFIPAPDVDATAYYAKGALIPISDTFMKPSVTIRELVRSVAVTGYENFTNVDPTPDPESMEPGDEPVQVIKWESSVDDQGVTWWYNPVDLLFENDESPELSGRQVSIDGVTLIGESSRQVIGWLSAAYFRQGEIRMDVINNAQYYPGQKVRVYADEDTIYTGYIQSCDFRFGLQARATLTISSNLEKVPSGKLTISYRYGDLLLGRYEVMYPDGEPYDLTNPVIGDYTPVTPRVTGTGDAVVQYIRHYPVRIEIVKPPNKLTYANGMGLDYTGMLVRVYDNTDKPWTQGGLFQDGFIPLRYLTLPEKQADINKAEISGKESELNIRPSIPPVQTGTYCCRIIDPVAHHYRPDYRYKSEYRITGGLLTTNVHKNADGTFHGFFRYILAADSPEASIEYTETRVNGEIAKQVVYHPRYSYTYKKRTVWYSSGGEAIAYDANIYIGPWTDHVSPMSSGDPVAPTAWTMIYGDTIDGYEKIPVQWQVPGTSQVFEDSFTILVTPDMNAPARIELTSLPDKLTYYDGDAIDYSGMVVTLYDQNGEPSTNYDEYPGGIVPLEKISGLPTIAKIGQNEHIDAAVQAHTILNFKIAFDIEIVANPYPVYIEVTTPPTKTSYRDHETIDFTGMVVTGYDKDGNLWNGDGVVPLSSLILPQRTASIDNAEVEQVACGGESTELLERGNTFQFWFADWWKGYSDNYATKAVGYRTGISDGILAKTNVIFDYGEYQSQISNILIASNNIIRYKRTIIMGSGEEVTYDSSSAKYQYTDENGRTVYWCWENKITDKYIKKGPINESTMIIDYSTAEKYRSSMGAYIKAWLDGQPTGVYRQYIPVRYQIPGKDKPLEAFFAVTIGEATT